MLPVVLAVSMVNVVARPGAALAAGGPSVPLPPVGSTPVERQTMSSRAPDQASQNALSGNQPDAGAGPDGGGTSTATSLAPSASWQVSPQTGDFTWSYPLRVPPAPGGLEPDLGLTYTSSTVDGRTSATNNQASWVGEGWDLSPGFVERTYLPCAADTMGGTVPPKVDGQSVGDLCWRSDNATASYGGGGGSLIRDDASGDWRTQSDDGSRVERLTGAGNGDDNGEYWKITKVDGTQYFFGSRPEARSTWTVPVFGDDVGEPCHAGTFETSRCGQAWRWNLDKVVDRHGNAMVYTYEAETNAYGSMLRDAAVPYVRGGTLKSIEYGLREGSAVPASGRVDFTTADRCVPGSDCTSKKENWSNWPDTPWDANCDTATCKDRYSPTFWSSRRLAKITTRVLRGSQFTDVDSWALDQQFPAPGDGEKAALWLRGITHTGLVGGSTALPAVTFEGTALANRVVKVDGVAPLARYRLTGIVSESGGVISIGYAPPDCVDGRSMPANPESNTLRCFPVRWNKRDFTERTDYFHKYVVAQVTQSDRISANTEQVTGYEYLDGAAWHYDTSEFTRDDRRTWNEFRGFGRVRIRTGKAGDPSGPVGRTEQRFYRGMQGDRLPNNGTRSVSVSATEGAARVDEDWLRGFPLETITYLGDTDQVVDKVINDPVWQGPTATRGSLKAYLLRTGASARYTALAAGGWRRTRVESGYDDRGLLTRTNDLGDLATAADDRCTRVTLARNTDRWLLDFPSRSETVAVNCAATATFPRDAISDVRTAYDGQAFGAAPTTGDATRTEELTERPASGPVYAMTATRRYDAHGRVVESGDALGNLSRIDYTPELGGPNTRVVSTNPLGHVSTSTIEPAWGLPTLVEDANKRKTETAYDPLGRRVEVWLPNRLRATHEDQPSSRFAYLVRRDAPSVVTTSTVNPRGNYTTSKELYDGLLRLRQAQRPAAGGGRLLTDTRYDSQGRVYQSTRPYFNDAALDDDLWVAADVDVPALTFTEFDGAGRRTAEIFKVGGAERWRTTTGYGGDRVHVTPPPGGTATTTISDARDQTTELRQYRGGTPSGDYDATGYTYTTAGKPATITDPAGNTWRFEYDLRGNRTRTVDVDKGTSTMTYDAAGRLRTSTDARDVTLTYDYDKLGRKTAVRSGTTTLSAWTYDTATGGKGQLAASTRYVDGAAYTRAVDTYSTLYKPTETTVTIPATPRTQTLAGSYTTYTSVNPDGSTSGKAFPRIGDLPRETVTWLYDDLANPIGLSGGPEGGPTVKYVTDTQYTRYGELARLQLGDTGKRTWQSYYYEDGTRRLNRTIVDAEVSTPMQADLHYTYDPVGNVTAIADTPLDRPADNQCLRYDHLRRLTEAWTPAGTCAAAPSTDALAGPAPYWQSFTYDAVGNRRSDTQHAAAGDTVRTYTYPAPGAPQAHAVTSVAATGPSGTRQDTYGYDPTGNVTARPGQQLDWDLGGQLTKVTGTGGDTEFGYDADGGRLIQRDSTGSTLYLDGQELRLTAATGSLTGTRYYGLGGDTVAVRTGSGLTWLASDDQGTAQVAVDSGTQRVTRRRQTPFGVPRGTAVAFPGGKGFVGGTVDAAIGTTHLGAREYDPVLGRFISVDPLVAPGDPQQLNAYTYAVNNPATYSDPTGLRPEDKPGYCVVWRGDCGFHPVEDAHVPSGSYTPEQVQRVKGQGRAPQSSCNRHGDCQAGKRGQSQAQRNVQAAKRKPPAPKPIPQLAPPPKRGSWSAGFCLGADFQFLYGHGGESCLVVDGLGIGWATGQKDYYGPGIGFATTVGLKGANTDITGLAGGETAFGGDVRLGPAEFGAEGAVSDDGSISGGVSAGPGAGIGYSGYAARGESQSGYYLRWDQPPAPNPFGGSGETSYGTGDNCCVPGL
ncbi:RHS repeat-associated core domain-containing protein [Micromonospora sp. NPDC049559]|uniref:RHS repeat-associated core domain-containing protein n=1 Tax=Micromonospora sp. NPDC049559 TaxID=3155923 RepID=UPI003420464F